MSETVHNENFLMYGYMVTITNCIKADFTFRGVVITAFFLPRYRKSKADSGPCYCQLTFCVRLGGNTTPTSQVASYGTLICRTARIRNY